jgi:hypothetical protein
MWEDHGMNGVIEEEGRGGDEGVVVRTDFITSRHGTLMGPNEYGSECHVCTFNSVLHGIG